MAHIIILDEFGNEIGRQEHDPGSPDGFVGSPEHRAEDEGDHAPIVVRLDIGKIIELHNLKQKKERDGD